MKTFDDQVLYIKGVVQFTLGNVLEQYAPQQIKDFPDPNTPCKIKRIPIHTIRQYHFHRPGSLDGARIAIDPDVEPLLSFYYRAPLERQLEVAKMELDTRVAYANRLESQIYSEKENGNLLFVRIKRFNDMSFWEKLIWILKGKGV